MLCILRLLLARAVTPLQSVRAQSGTARCCVSRPCGCPASLVPAAASGRLSKVRHDIKHCCSWLMQGFLLRCCAFYCRRCIESCRLDAYYWGGLSTVHAGGGSCTHSPSRCTPPQPRKHSPQLSYSLDRGLGPASMFLRMLHIPVLPLAICRQGSQLVADAVDLTGTRFVLECCTLRVAV